MKRPGAKAADICGAIGIAAVLVVFTFFTVVGSYSTCAVEIFTRGTREYVVFSRDSILLNLCVLLCAGCLFSLLGRGNVSRRTVLAAQAAALLSLTALGGWWVLSARALPGADSFNIMCVAERLALEDVQALTAADYFRKLPYQLGYLSYAEACIRLFGMQSAYAAMGLLNVLWVDALYLALLSLGHRLFPDNRTQLITGILLLLCLQPVFLTTFLYGVLPGAALAMWSVYFIVRYLQGGRWTSLIPGAALLALAVLLKKNNWIILIACAIVLLLHALRNRRPGAILGVLLSAALAVLLPAGVQRGYEVRTGTQFGPGTPLGAWLAIGFTESPIGPGWYSDFASAVLSDNGYDQAATRDAIRTELQEALQKFQDKPRYLANFMYHKIVSQWNEPAFQCIWSSAAGEHSGAVPPAVQRLYDNESHPGQGMNGYFNLYVEFIYACFALCMLRMLLKQKDGGMGIIRRDELLILPVAVFGGFLYHALFEAKAQYALAYLPMLLPYAARALTELLPQKQSPRTVSRNKTQ